MEVDYKAIGKYIRFYRIESGYTQEELANLVNISIPHMSNIERGLTKVSFQTLVNVVEALDISFDNMMFNNSNQSVKKQNSVFDSIVKDCSQRERAIIIDVVQSMVNGFRNT